MFKATSPYRKQELPSAPAKPPEPAKPPSPSREEIVAMIQQVLAENSDVVDSNYNGQQVADFLKEYNALLCLESFRTAVTYLRNRGQLELKPPPAPPPSPIVVERPLFDYAALKDSDELPLDTPEWRLKTATSAQLRSFLKRAEAARKQQKSS